MEGGGGGVDRRISTFWDQMSALETRLDSLAGLTLDDVVGTEKQSAAASPGQMNRTLLDVIRDEEPRGSLFGHKDKKSWKVFRDRLRLKRAGGAWTSSVVIPTSDIPVQNNNYSYSNGHNNPRSLLFRRNSVRFTTVSPLSPTESNHAEDSNENSTVSSSRPQMIRRNSVRFGSSAPIPSDSSESDGSSINIRSVGDDLPSRSFRPQMSRHNSTRYPSSHPDLEDDNAEPERGGTRRLAAALAEERSLSAREAVAAQEAAEAEAAAQAAAAAEEEAESAVEVATEAQPVRMSLMDLLEETDRQMGLEGLSYTVRDEEEYEEEDDDGDEEYEGGSVEHTCCVCMVRHKGAAFIPCGHTFCRLCSRELWVQRGNCPLCNGFILEILDIF